MWRNFMQTFYCTIPASKQLLLWLSTNLNTGFCHSKLCCIYAWLIGQPLEAAQETRYHQRHPLHVGRDRDSALADVSHGNWGQLRCFIRNQASTTLCHVALLWHGDILWTETLQSLRKGQGKDSLIHEVTEMEATCYRADAFFVWTLSKGDRTGLCSSRFPGFSLGKEFKKEWANVLPSMRQISKMHAPTGWVTKTILSLKMVLVPVIYVQQMRNYSGSSCSTRTSSCSSELWFFICFVATFHNVKNWGPSPLTFPAQTTVVPCKSIACGEIQYLSHVSCCSRKWCTV